uniref:MBD domain-containing protein n=1 Tax=Leersia perrieri TaxID=77586 RepID=A0A0D9XBS0_9ORYZ
MPESQDALKYSRLSTFMWRMSPCMKPQGRKETLSLPDGWKIEKKKYRHRTDKFYREKSTGKLCRSIPEIKRYLEQKCTANLKSPLDMDVSSSFSPYLYVNVFDLFMS